MNKSLILGIFSFLLVFGTSQLNAQKTKELEKQEKMAEKEAKKAEKEVRLSQIVVTTSTGNVFDGNETARINMLSAIMSAELINKTEEYWKLADNSTKLVSLDELKEALALAIQEVGNIVKDY